MSTEFINDQWRLPNAWNGSESNVNKQSNYSMDFDGSNSINLGNVLNQSGDNAFSISVWVYIKSSSTSMILGKQETSGNFTGYAFQLINSKFRFALYESTTANVVIDTNNSLNTNQWYHLTGTYNGSKTSSGVKLYINGSEENTTSVGQGSFSNISNTVDFSIGSRANSQIFFNGQIDAVAIYNYELSSSQVTTLYGSSSTGIGNPMSLSPKPVAYYPLGDQDAFNGADYLVPNSSLKDYVFDFIPNDYIDTGAASFSGLTEMSVSAWVKPTATGTGAAEAILSTEAASPNRGFYLSLFVGSKFRWQVSTDGSNKDSLDNGTIVLNEWTHIVATWNQSTMNLYVNGSLAGTMSTVNATGTFTTTNNMFIGQRTSGAGYFPGNISNVQFFDTALPATGSNSVETLYNNGSPLTSMTGFTSLVSWWKLDASDTYDSSTGNWTIEDHAGTNDGTSSGMTQANLVQSDLSFTSGFSPYALDFDAASSDAITLGNTIGNSFTQITCSIWANISTSGLTQSTYRNFLVKFPTGGFSATPFELRSSNGNRVDTYNNKLFFRVNTNTGSYGYTDTGFEFTEANKWHHLVGTYDGSNVKLFVDGVEYYSISASGTLNSNPNNATIGKSGSTGDFNGKLSNASIWNAALTSAQVTELYNEGVPSNLNNHSAYSNLVSWWQLGSNSSFNTNWTVLDEKGSNNGTSVNMGEDAIVDGVGSYANGLSSGMGGDEVIGSAPFSDANSLSYNMDVLDRSTDVPN